MGRGEADSEGQYLEAVVSLLRPCDQWVGRLGTDCGLVVGNDYEVLMPFLKFMSLR